MAIKKKIIEEAKTKESWSANHKFNYGPIKYLYEQVVEKCAPKLDVVEKAIAEFEKHVHRVTDAETYFVWQHCKYDLIVNSNYLILDIRHAFPEVPFLTVCEWLRKYEGEQQTNTCINMSLVPKDIAEKIGDLYSIPPTHKLLRQ